MDAHTSTQAMNALDAAQAQRGSYGRAAWMLAAAALVLRVVYLAEYVELPFLYGPVFDAQVYLAQADAVRAGRFGDATLLAFSPLYGYFLAALGAHAGSIAPVLVQLLLGLLNLALVARITRALFDARAALWAAGCYAAYGPLLFFETKIMSETLGLSLLLWALAEFASPAFAAGRLGASARCGLALGLAVLARASLLFCVPCLALAAVFRRPDAQVGDAPLPSARAAALRRSLGFGLSACLLLGGYGLFTRAHSGLFVPVIMVSNSAAQATRGEFKGDLRAFQTGSAPQVGAWSVVEQAQARLSALRRGAPDPAAVRGAAQGVDLAGWLRQLPAKTWLTLRDVETTFDYGYYGERSELPALYAAFASFGMLVCCALLGCWQALRERRVQALLTLLPVVGGVMAVTTLFHPSTRYRLPMLVALAPLAGLAWARAQQRVHSAGRPGALLLALAAIALLFAPLQAWRGLSQPGIWQLRVAEAAAMAHDLPTCRARVQSALALQPGSSDVAQRARYVASLLPGCGPR